LNLTSHCVSLLIDLVLLFRRRSKVPKLYILISFLFFFSTYKKKFTYDVLSGIATCLLDGTVFEIVKGLEDIQQLSERNLLNKRMKIVNSQKGRRLIIASFHGEIIVYGMISLEVTEDKGEEKRILQPVLFVLGELANRKDLIVIAI